MDNVKIETLKNGAAIEMANHELQKIFDDIADVNKKYDSPRELTLKVKFIPTEDGTYGTAVISVASTLGKQKEQKASLSFGSDGRKGLASENLNVSQPNFNVMTDNN